MLEALVTVALLAFGVLGLVGLQAKMQLVEMESYQRSQALVLLEDMAARLNANRANAAAYTAYGSGNPLGTGDGQPALKDCAAQAIGLARDVCEWSNALKGAAETSGVKSVGAAIDGRGCIDAIAGSDPPSYLVTVAWQGMHNIAAPSYGCAQNLYGNDGFRRAIGKVVTIANLTPP
jgi:type IV pilus assembly protein PilV